MAESIVRKCDHCKESIHIDRNNVHDVLMFKNKYYHNRCFEERVKQRLAGKQPHPMWKDALDHVSEYENDAKEAIEFWFTRDDIYNHILEHYDVIKVESPIFTRIDAVITGTYGRKSKPIDYADFVECWRYGQSKLEEIARKNRAAGKNITGEARVNYDLAVVVKKFPQWKKWQEKLKAERIEIEKAQRETVRINYDKMIRTEIKHEGLDDISALLDEF
jgi:hypothetical protein